MEIDGDIYVIECKNSFSFRMDEWENGNVPNHYVMQGRYYTAVVNVKGVIFLCLHGNNENTFIERRLGRDLVLEEELIEQERFFWNQNVLKGIPPRYTEKASLVLKRIQNRFEIQEGVQIFLPPEMGGNIMSYLELKQKKSELLNRLGNLKSR